MGYTIFRHTHFQFLRFLKSFLSVSVILYFSKSSCFPIFPLKTSSTSFMSDHCPLECTAAYSTAIRCYQMLSVPSLLNASHQAPPAPQQLRSRASDQFLRHRSQMWRQRRRFQQQQGTWLLQPVQPGALGGWVAPRVPCMEDTWWGYKWDMLEETYTWVLRYIMRISSAVWMNQYESMHLVLHTSSHRQPPQKRHRQPSTLSVSVSLWNMPSNLGRLGFGKTVKRYPLSSSLLSCSVSSVCSVRLCQYLQLGFVCSFCPCRNDGQKLDWCSLLWRFCWFWIVF